MSLIMQPRLFLYFNHAHFLMPHPFYNNNHACLQSSWVVCHLLHLFVQFDNTLFSFLNFCKSRTTNLMNTEKELQSFFVNNLHMENQLYIYASLQKLESGNWEFLIFSRSSRGTTLSKIIGTGPNSNSIFIFVFHIHISNSSWTCEKVIEIKIIKWTMMKWQDRMTDIRWTD